jgi:uncharacterized membrane protein YeaQ/YmgE (transglycosylase-associated protein family)
MSIIAWVTLGLVAGFIASRYISRDGEGVVPYLIIGVIGAALGGYAFETLGAGPTTGFLDRWGLLTSLAGAAVLLLAHHAIRKFQSRTS